MQAFATPLVLARTGACVRVARAGRPTRATAVPVRAAALPEGPGEVARPNAASPDMVLSGARAPAPPQPDEIVFNSAAEEEKINAIRQQMEFWFSSSNLRRDWYLRRQMDPSGWLDPAIFLLFNRVKQLNATVDDIIMACRSSTSLEVSSPANDGSSFGDAAGQTRIRRSSELPDFRTSSDNEAERSLIVTGIGENADVKAMQTMFEPFAEVTYVRLYPRKDPDPDRRALVCFADAGTAERVCEEFLASPPEGAESIVVKRRRANSFGDANGESSYSGQRQRTTVFKIDGIPKDLNWRFVNQSARGLFSGLVDNPMRYLLYNNGEGFCYVTVNDNDEANAVVDALVANGVVFEDTLATVHVLKEKEELATYWAAANENSALRRARRSERDGQATDGNYSNMKGPTVFGGNPAGVIVKLSKLPDSLRWQEIKGELQEKGRVVYLNHERGSGECFVRFSNPEEAQSVAQAFSGPDAALFFDAQVEAIVLVGDEEEEYWRRAEESRQKRLTRDTNGV